MENQLPHLAELMWMAQMIGGLGAGTEVGVHEDEATPASPR